MLPSLVVVDVCCLGWLIWLRALVGGVVGVACIVYTWWFVLVIVFVFVGLFV